MTLPGGFFAGQLLQDRYELRNYVAGGGMGMVYRGWDTVLERDVALKRVTFTGQSSEEEADNRARTLREARLGAHLGAHPHIISIYDRQEIDGDVWLVMEYLESLSLAQLTADGHRLDISEAARIGAAIAEALAHAHGKGITHRDVKPANILLSPDQRQIKLADFGIAHRDHDPSLTATNVVTGTIAYMPREVARGDTPGDPQADIYSLGATLYEIVEGDTPHGRDTNANRLLIRAAHEPPRPPQHAGPFGPLLQQMLAPDSSTRPTADGARRLLADFAERHRNVTSPPTTINDNSEASGNSAPLGLSQVQRLTAVLRRRRRALFGTMSVVLAAGIVIALAAGLASAPSENPSAAGSGGSAARGATSTPAPVPDLPTSVAPITITGDFPTANPCAVLDPAVMSRFGTPKIGPGGDIGTCRIATVSTALKLNTDISYGSRASNVGPVQGPGQNLGGVTLVRRGVTRGAETCESTILFPDANYLRIATSTSERTAPPAACAANEVALAVALNKLQAAGITYEPNWQRDVSMAGRKSCEVAAPEVPRILPDVSPNVRGYPNGSFCFFGDRRVGRPYVSVRLGLEPSGNLGRYGASSIRNGKGIYSREGAADVTGNGSTCYAYVIHRPSFDGGLTKPAEFVSVAFEGTPSKEDRCERATQLALAVEGRL